MLKKLLFSFSQARQNIRSRLFHTLLSILGIVIGVAALVAVLSLIDGLEKYAKDQISGTSVTAVYIQPNSYKTVNNLRVKKENLTYLDRRAFQDLLSTVKREGKLMTTESREVQVEGAEDTFGVFITALSIADTSIGLAHGTYFSEQDMENRAPVGYVNHYFAEKIGDTTEALLGREVSYTGRRFRIQGILRNDKMKHAAAYIPFTLIPEEDLKEIPPMAIVRAESVEEMPELKKTIENWIAKNYPGSEDDFTVVTDKYRVDRAAKGFTVFRIVMGIIVGISVLVGGIGVMNVLLISVNERTVEIGVRKSMGAKRKDIMLQFLAEAISISLLGSLLGVLLGIFMVSIFVLIIKAFADVPFQAAYTLNTFLVITTVAIAIGIIFGTYPAMRAARLNPVDAIRRE